MILERAKAIFLVLGGVAMVAGGIFFGIKHGNSLIRYERASGVVVGTDVQRVRGSRLHHAIVRFTDEQGTPRQFREDAGLWFWVFEEGDEVPVLYAPDQTDDAIIGSFWTLWFLPLVLAALGGACLVAGRHAWRSLGT